MTASINKFFSSCFRPNFKNDAGKTEQASTSQASQASAPPPPQQKKERTSFSRKFTRLFTPGDVAAKAAKFDRFQAQANAELKRATEQLNAAAAEFTRMMETLKNKVDASSSTPHHSEHSSSFSHSSAPYHREHTPRPQPSAPPYPGQMPTRQSFFASPSTFLDPIAHFTGFNKHINQVNSQWQQAAQNFEKLRYQPHSQYQQTAQNFDHLGNQIHGQWQQTAQHLEQLASPHFPLNLTSNPAGYLNPHYPPPIHFTNPVFVSSSMSNNNLDAHVQHAIERLQQGGFTHAQLRDLADDIKTLRESIGGTGANHEIVNSIRQKYVNVFRLQSEEELGSPFFEKMRQTILAGNRNA